MDTEYLPLSKKKSIPYFLGSLLFSILGALMILTPQYFTHSTDITFTKVIGYGCLVFFGLGVALFAIKIFNKKPGLILNKDGITDQTSAIGIGIIQWTDIKSIYLEKVSEQSFIMIEVKNPQQYLQKQKNPIARRAMEINMQLYKTPLHINVSLLTINATDLLDKMLAHFKN